MVVVVLDSAAGVMEEDRELLKVTKNRRALIAANKSDLAAAPLQSLDGLKLISTSALTGAGIAELRQEILNSISGQPAGEQESGFLTNIRHQRLVEESLTSLAAARKAVQGKIPHEMIMIDLYGALRPLDAITGETTADDILNLIFSSFCIGK
jgi:tRNA modification GTPase